MNPDAPTLYRQRTAQIRATLREIEAALGCAAKSTAPASSR